MSVRKLPILFLALALALAAAACGGDEDTSIDVPGGGEIDIDGDDGGITISGPSGEVNIGTGEYPDGWPSDFPIPDGATPAYSVDAGGGVAVWFASDQSVEDLTAFFTGALPGAGYTVDSTMDFDDGTGSYTVMTVSGNGLAGGIYMGEDLGAVAAGFEGEFNFWVSLAPA
jgi:hypothetical protein